MAKEQKIPQALIDKEWKGACTIIIPIFGGDVTLFVGSDEDLSKYYKNTKSASTRQLVNKLCANRPYVSVERGITVWDGVSILLKIPKLDMNDEGCVETLYHEALHAALLTMNRTGAEIGDGGETLAYLQGYIVKALLGEMKRGAYGTLLPDGTKIGACKRGLAPEKFVDGVPGLSYELKEKIISKAIKV